MRLVRSWPASPPPTRSHPRIIDAAERVEVANYCYKTLPDGPLIHLDWDIAVHREDLYTFAAFASETPDRVSVAPYKIYGDSKRSDLKYDRGKTVWAMRRIEGGATRIVTEDDQTCHLFGFGMVYLPAGVIKEAVEAFPDRDLDDGTFSQWHHLNKHAETPICWQVRPVHLHYRIDKLGI